MELEPDVMDLADGGNPNETLGFPCSEYEDNKYRDLAILAASVGVVSMVASIMVILIILLFKKHHMFIQRLILYLCI